MYIAITVSKCSFIDLNSFGRRLKGTYHWSHVTHYPTSCLNFEYSSRRKSKNDRYFIAEASALLGDFCTCAPPLVDLFGLFEEAQAHSGYIQSSVLIDRQLKLGACASAWWWRLAVELELQVFGCLCYVVARSVIDGNPLARLVMDGDGASECHPWTWPRRGVLPRSIMPWSCVETTESRHRYRGWRSHMLEGNVDMYDASWRSCDGGWRVGAVQVTSTFLAQKEY